MARFREDHLKTMPIHELIEIGLDAMHALNRKAKHHRNSARNARRVDEYFVTYDRTTCKDQRAAEIGG